MIFIDVFFINGNCEYVGNTHDLKFEYLKDSTGSVALSIQGTEQRLRWPTSSFEAALKEHGYSM